MMKGEVRGPESGGEVWWTSPAPLCFIKQGSKGWELHACTGGGIAPPDL